MGSGWPAAGACWLGSSSLGEAALRDGGVHLLLLDALLEEGLGGCELFVDDFLKSRERLRPPELSSVDEEVRGAARPELGCEGLVPVDCLLVRSLVESFLDLRRVEAGFFRVAFELWAAERLLVGEERVVDLPELVVTTLCVGFHGHRGCRARIVVESKRIVAPDDADLVAVGVDDLLSWSAEPERRRGTGTR